MFDYKEYKKEYYQKNKEKYSAISKIRYAENKEKILAQRKRKYDSLSQEERDKRRKYIKDWQEANPDTMRAYTQTDHNKYIHGYRQPAAKRGYAFSLTFEDFLPLFHGKCNYCGKLDARGIDRVDNSVGYVKENCVSCCEICNKMKWKFTQQDFLKQVKQIYESSNLENYA